MSADGPPSEASDRFYAVFCTRELNGGCGRLGVVNKRFVADNLATSHIHPTRIVEVRDLEGNPKD